MPRWVLSLSPLTSIADVPKRYTAQPGPSGLSVKSVFHPNANASPVSIQTQRTQRTQRKRLRLDGNRALAAVHIRNELYCYGARWKASASISKSKTTEPGCYATTLHAWHGVPLVLPVEGACIPHGKHSHTSSSAAGSACRDVICCYSNTHNLQRLQGRNIFSDGRRTVFRNSNKF